MHGRAYMQTVIAEFSVCTYFTQYIPKRISSCLSVVGSTSSLSGSDAGLLLSKKKAC